MAQYTFPADLDGFLPEPFPVGSVFIAVVDTDPATLLGYGTWSAFGAGKVLVGIDSSDTDFDTAEETGGSKTHDHSDHSDLPIAERLLAIIQAMFTVVRQVMGAKQSGQLLILPLLLIPGLLLLPPPYLIPMQSQLCPMETQGILRQLLPIVLLNRVTMRFQLIVLKAMFHLISLFICGKGRLKWLIK